jgi:hypothetical protein
MLKGNIRPPRWIFPGPLSLPKTNWLHDPFVKNGAVTSGGCFVAFLPVFELKVRTFVRLS